MCSNHHDEYGYPRHINTESYDVTKNLYWFWNEQQKKHGALFAQVKAV